MTINFYFVLVFLLGCLFAYTNGFQDGSSVAASPIASRSIGMWQGVLLTAIFEFLGALLGGSQVASAIAGITNYPRSEPFLYVLACALLAAILWNFLTRLFKVPSSSTHALVGGLIGAIFASTGSFEYIVWGSFNALIHPTGVCKVIATLFLSPLVGFGAGYFTLHLLQFLLSRATNQVNNALKSLQLLVLPVLAFGHGANDTQKVMGVIVMAMSAAGLFGRQNPLASSESIPLWVRITIGAFMVFGVVCMAPGILKRVGLGIFKQRPVHGFASEFASAVVVLTGSITGGPVSASQVIASTVMGVGYANRRKGVHWLVAREMAWAWFLTIPCSAAFAFLLFRLIFGALKV
ncbi:MAG: inorganic phosphate transporter [Candidatus Obscuribacterales bacterium]|jgi:PiT family inorganic phosphate transporter